MANLARSQKLLVAPLVLIAVEDSGTSDVSTKPAAASGAWLEVPCANQVEFYRLLHDEEYDCTDADTGWTMDTDRYVLGYGFKVRSRYMTSLYERLIRGLENDIVEGTAQTPHVVAQPQVNAWVKLQFRKAADGQDRSVEDYWCRIRPEDHPTVEKATLQPVFDIRVLRSSLNAVDFPAVV